MGAVPSSPSGSEAGPTCTDDGVVLDLAPEASLRGMAGEAEGGGLLAGVHDTLEDMLQVWTTRERFLECMWTPYTPSVSLLNPSRGNTTTRALNPELRNPGTVNLKNINPEL